MKKGDIMKVIGLTGNSGCGKGAISCIMKEYGAVVADCDKIAHRNMQSDGIAYRDILNSFGNEILKADGEIDRKKLGAIVFNDSEKLSQLNSITHKYIEREVLSVININRDKKCVVIDAPLLIEAGLESYCDKVWVVNAPFETRIKRVMERDNIDRESAVLRFKNQRDFKDIKVYADTVIENDGNMEDLKKKIFKIMNDEGLI